MLFMNVINLVDSIKSEFYTFQQHVGKLVDIWRENSSHGSLVNVTAGVVDIVLLLLSST